MKLTNYGQCGVPLTQVLCNGPMTISICWMNLGHELWHNLTSEVERLSKSFLN